MKNNIIYYKSSKNFLNLCGLSEAFLIFSFLTLSYSLYNLSIALPEMLSHLKIHSDILLNLLILFYFVKNSEIGLFSGGSISHSG
jgi:hypothetical protein